MLVEAKTREWDTEHSRKAWVVQQVMEIRKVDYSAATTQYERVLKDILRLDRREMRRAIHRFFAP